MALVETASLKNTQKLLHSQRWDIPTRMHRAIQTLQVTWSAFTLLIASSRLAKSHNRYCRDNLPNKLCCYDGVGTGQNQEDLRANCQICMLPPTFHVVWHYSSWLDASSVGNSAACNNSGNTVCCAIFWVGLQVHPNKRRKKFTARIFFPFISNMNWREQTASDL